jgi:hypothetical protein
VDTPVGALPVSIRYGPHLFPSRTQKLSRNGRWYCGCGRVGGRRLLRKTSRETWRFFFLRPLRGNHEDHQDHKVHEDFWGGMPSPILMGVGMDSFDSISEKTTPNSKPIIVSAARGKTGHWLPITGYTEPPIPDISPQRHSSCYVAKRYFAE